MKVTKVTETTPSKNELDIIGPTPINFTGIYWRLTNTSFFSHTHAESKVEHIHAGRANKRLHP